LGKIGVLVALESKADKAKLLELGKHIAMHIAAAAPITLNIAGVDPAAVEHEKSIFAEQAKASGKAENIIEKMEAALNDLQKVKQIKDEQVTMLIQEKTTYIEQLQQRLEEYELLNEREAKSLEKKIIMSDIYQHFQYLAQHPREEVTIYDWEALQLMLEEQLPNFHPTIYHYCPNLPKNDYRLCMLVRLYFSPSDIAVLTDMTIANISVKRYRLLDNVFNLKEGSAKDFDPMVRNIR
jgi:hypothetical protein